MRNLRTFRFIGDESGGGTVWGLLSFILTIGVFGLAVDSNDGFHARTGLQATANAAALAAVIDLPDEAAALATAQRYAARNMPSALNGTILRSEDIKFGRWDANTRTFMAGAAPADAIRVVMHRSLENDNEVSLNFLRTLGLSAWGDVRAEAVAQRYVPRCLREGVFARRLIDISSKKSFVENDCVFSQEGMNAQIDKYHEAGSTLSMPDPDTILAILEGGMETNSCLEDALRANSYNAALADDLSKIFDRCPGGSPTKMTKVAHRMVN